jgi:hypothetical protein
MATEEGAEMFRTIKRRVAGRVAVVALVVLALPPWAGAAAWLSPIHVGGTTGLAPSGAVDAFGDALVGWQEGTPGVIHAAHHAAGTPGFTVLPNVSTSSFDSSTPVVVVNRSGNGLVAWVQTVSMMGAQELDILAFQPNGTPSGVPVHISGGGSSLSNITAAIDANGDAVVAWEKGGMGVVGVSRQGLTGAFTNTTTPATLDGSGSAPVAAIDGAGNAIVVMFHNNVLQTVSESHHLAGGSTWTPFALLAPGGHIFTAPAMAANASGAMVVAFLDNGVASAVSGTVTGGWGTPTVKPLATVAASHGPEVSVAANGAALVGWTTSSAVQTSFRPAGGNFPAAGSVASIPIDTPDDFALGGSARGDAIVAWSSFDTQFMQNVVRAAVRPAGANSFGAPKIVSDTHSYGSKPKIALDEQGDAVLAYPEGATPQGVDIVVYDGAAPVVSTATGPSKIQVGSRATFHSSAADAFSPFSPTWSFGDGSKSATGASVTHAFTRAGRFTVKLTVTDTAANTTSKSLSLIVTPKPLPPCIVPKLKGKSLTTARRLLSRAHCKLGKVHRPRPRKHHKQPKLVVTKTSPGAGAKRRNGTKVDVTLGPAPKPKPKHRKH